MQTGETTVLLLLLLGLSSICLFVCRLGRGTNAAAAERMLPRVSQMFLLS